MKISVSSLIGSSGISCNHVITNVEGEVFQKQAKVAFVTEKTVREVRSLQISGSGFEARDDSLDMTYGSLAAVYRDADGVAQVKIYSPGEQAPFTLRVSDREIAFSGQDMLSAREEMVSATKDGATLNVAQLRMLSGLQDIFEMVCSAPDAERFPSSLVAQSYHAFMIDHFGSFDISVSVEEFVRKARADLIRARIGLLDPGHKDAIGTSRQLRQILSDAGIEVSADGIGIEVVSPAALRINEEAIRRTIMSNEKMTRDVFGALTRTPVDRLSAAMIRLEDVDTLKEKNSGNLLTGDWVDMITHAARYATMGASDSYHFSMDIFALDGRDIAVVIDTVGKQQGVAFVYSWPSAERFPVMDIDGDRVMNISSEEIPSPEEFQRLSEVLGQIEALGFHDPDRQDADTGKSRFDQ